MQPISPIAFYRLRIAQDATHSDGFKRLARQGISHLILSAAAAKGMTWIDSASEGLVSSAREAGLAVCVDFSGDAAALPQALLDRLSDRSIAGLRIPDPDVLADPIRTIRSLAGELASYDAILIVAGALGERPDLRRLEGLFSDPGDSDGASGHVLLDLAGLSNLDRLSADTGGESFRTLVTNARQAILGEGLDGRLDAVLAELHASISTGVPRDVVRSALQAFVLAAPDAPIYLDPTKTSTAERVSVERVIALARATKPELGSTVFDRLGAILSGDEQGAIAAALNVLRLVRVIRRDAQRRAALAQHRVVGMEAPAGDPVASLTRGRFHDLMRRRQRDHGMRLVVGSDGKLGEEARSRLIGLADLSIDWAHIVAESDQLARPLASYVGGHATPSPGERLLFYQLLAAAWPSGGADAAFVEMIKGLFSESLRRAKASKSDPGHELACAAFVDRFLAADELVSRFQIFARRAALVGSLVGLARLTLKVTTPGTPSFGDHPAPKEHAPEDFATLVADWPSGRLHAALAARLLRLRWTLPHLFGGTYEPIPMRGGAGRILAFARRSGSESLVIVTPTRFAALTAGGTAWPSRIAGSIELTGRAENLLTGAQHDLNGPTELSRLFDPLPLAVLHMR